MVQKKKIRIVKVKELPYSVEYVFDVGSLTELKRNFNRILEAPNAFYGRDQDGVFFRFRKPNFKPVIRKAHYVTVHPEQNLVSLPREELEAIATHYNADLLETVDALVMMTHGLVFISLKTEEQKR